jgi:hypothetical protein
MANDKVETHRLSCLSCSASFNAKGNMPMEIICPSLQKTAKCEKSLALGEYNKEQKKTLVVIQFGF